MLDDADPRDARWFLEKMPSNDVLVNVLRGDPVTRLLGIARDRAVANPGLEVVPRHDADEQAVAATLELAMATAKRIAEGGEQIPLGPEEKSALDLFILLVARPAIFVQGGRVQERPENWPEVARDELLLQRIIAGVGRIETGDRRKKGTGFIVGPKRILTNNHVLCALFGMRLEDWERQPASFAQQCVAKTELWLNDTKAAPIFELRGEFGSTESTQVKVRRVLGHHLEVDMAVLEIDADPTGSRKLPLMTTEPATFEGRRIYAVGYPVDDVFDGHGLRITPAPVFRRVFGADDESLGTKRFSPGLVIGWLADRKFQHDASTLPGSSGSCIVDFERQRVVGLHYGGRYSRRSNYAVALWKFANDPVLTSNGVEFD